jgi:hypothetical protein
MPFLAIAVNAFHWRNVWTPSPLYGVKLVRFRDFIVALFAVLSARSPNRPMTLFTHTAGLRGIIA